MPAAGSGEMLEAKTAPKGVCDRPAAREAAPVRSGVAHRAIARPPAPAARARSWRPRRRTRRARDRRDRGSQGQHAPRQPRAAAARRRRGPAPGEARRATRSVAVRPVDRRRRRQRVQGGAHALGREGRLAEADAGRVEDGVGDGGGARHRCGFADAERRLLGPVHRDDLDGGQLREGQDRVAAPVPRGRQARLEGHLLVQHAARRLDDVAVDLVLDPGGIDHQAGILPHDDPLDRDLAAGAVDRHVGHPGRPGRRRAGELAVDVDRIGEAAAAQPVAVRRHGCGTVWGSHPARSATARTRSAARASVQVPQPVCDRVDARRSGEFVDEALVGEGVRQRRHAADPGGARDRRHVVHGDPRVIGMRRAGWRCGRPSRRPAATGATTPVSSSARVGAPFDG